MSLKPKITVDVLLAKINRVKTEKHLDLSTEEDLSIGLMNLISIEEHLFFTASKTGKTKYFDLLNEVREMRKKLLKQIIKNPEGEEWCISKHLLAGSMRLIEVGTKKLSKGEKKDAHELFQMAYSLYNLFWGINLKLLKTDEMKDLPSDPDSPKGFMAKLGKVIKEAIDCCIE